MAEREIILTLTASISANSPSGTTVAMTIKYDPKLAGKDSIQVPNDEAWVIEDVYVDSSQTPNGHITFKRSLKEILGVTPPINSLLVSNPSRPFVAPMLLKPGDVLTAEFTTLASVGTGGASVTVYAKVKVFD